MTERWYGVWTWAGQERAVWRALHDLGLGPYLPKRYEIVVRQGKSLRLARPLFPGYVFLRVASWRDEHWDDVLSVEGVGGILTDNGVPVHIPDTQLANPLYSDILAFLKGKDPQNPIFRSKTQRRREMRQKAWLEKMRVD
jgi:transcription antitermination factor NusG